MTRCVYRRLGPVPAVEFWFEDSSRPRGVPWDVGAALVGNFLVERFVGRALWILADPDRDAYLSADIEVDGVDLLVDAQRGSGLVNVGRTPAARSAFLSVFTEQTGFSWDGYCILSGEHDRATIPELTEEWLNSQASLHNIGRVKENTVPAEALYTCGDGSMFVWVPIVPLDEAIRLIFSQGEISEAQP